MTSILCLAWAASQIRPAGFWRLHPGTTTVRGAGGGGVGRWEANSKHPCPSTCGWNDYRSQDAPRSERGGSQPCGCRPGRARGGGAGRRAGLERAGADAGWLSAQGPGSSEPGEPRSLRIARPPAAWSRAVGPGRSAGPGKVGLQPAGPEAGRLHPPGLRAAGAAHLPNPR